MIITDRVRYLEYDANIPNRGRGVIVSALTDGRVVVRWDSGILNVCDISRLERVI